MFALFHFLVLKYHLAIQVNAVAAEKMASLHCREEW